VRRDACKVVACSRVGLRPRCSEQALTAGLYAALTPRSQLGPFVEVVGGIEALRAGPTRDLLLRCLELHEEDDAGDDLKRLLDQAGGYFLNREGEVT